MGKWGQTDLSEFIVVGVDIMKAFDNVTWGPQDATWVDRIKEVHGDSSARYLLYFHTHRPVYTHTGETRRGVIAGTVQFPFISAEKLCGGHDIPRGTGAPVSTFEDRLAITLGSLKKHYRKTSGWQQNNDFLSEMDERYWFYT